MADNTSSSLPIKILWQVTLVVGLILGVWVLGRTLPLEKWIPQLKNIPSSATASHSGGAKVEVYPLPKMSATGTSALDAVAGRLSLAKSEILIATRSMTAGVLWSAVSAQAQKGVTVSTLFTPETTTEFAKGKLAEWLRGQNLTTVYKDVMASASNVIVIDGQTVILSDLPFSKWAFEPTSAEMASGTTLGFVYIIDSTELGAEVSKALRSRIISANKLL